MEGTFEPGSKMLVSSFIPVSRAEVSPLDDLRPSAAEAGRTIIVETKGLQDVDVEPKLRRLRQWCEDVNRVQGASMFDYVYVDQESFEKYRPKSVADLLSSFLDYKTAFEHDAD
jgi:hypothetical protein